MYELAVQRAFRASHAITMAGRREQTHGHHWQVRVVVSGREVNRDGLLCDFHWLQRQLDAVLAPLEDRDLNTVSPFKRVNPTAEHIARHIADEVSVLLPEGVELASVGVTEAPGCTATYRPQRRPASPGV